MDELVKTVSEQTGLPEEQARKATEAVINVLKERLPEPLAGQIDKLIENPGVADSAENLLDLGKGLFNRNK